MYTQRQQNPHNALWDLRAEWIPASRQKVASAAESSIHLFYTTQVQINCKLTGFMHNFRDRVQDTSFNLTTGAARLKWLINRKQTAKAAVLLVHLVSGFTHSFSFTPSRELYEWTM